MMTTWEIIAEEIARPRSGEKPLIDVDDLWNAGWHEGYFSETMVVEDGFFYCSECMSYDKYTIVDMYAWGYDFFDVRKGESVVCPFCGDTVAEHFQVMEIGFVSSYNRRMYKLCVSRGYVPEGYDDEIYDMVVKQL